MVGVTGGIFDSFAQEFLNELERENIFQASFGTQALFRQKEYVFGTNAPDAIALVNNGTLKALYGLGSGDTLTGTNILEKIVGGTGNDTIDGLGGDDIITDAE